MWGGAKQRACTLKCCITPSPPALTQPHTYPTSGRQLLTCPGNRNYTALVPHSPPSQTYTHTHTQHSKPPQIRPAVAVTYPGTRNYTVVVPQRGIWGTAGIDGANIDHVIDNEGKYESIEVSGESLDQVRGSLYYLLRGEAPTDHVKRQGSNTIKA